jgi:hypothetical protein
VGPLRKSSLIFAVITITLSLCGTAGSQGTPTVAVDLQAFSFEGKHRRDPFEPVPLVKARKVREDSGVKGRSGEQLKQGFEMEELKLVGVIDRDKTKYAMMEDLQGKGVLFKKGDPINPQIWIVDIVESRVVFGYRAKGIVRKFEMEIEKR